MLNLFVLDAEGDKVPVYVSAATPDDLRATAKWQTQWTSKAALEMPNKVALPAFPAHHLAYPEKRVHWQMPRNQEEHHRRFC